MVATVTRLNAAAMTVHYFEVDGYYARNDPEHRKASRWHARRRICSACTGGSIQNASRLSLQATCPAPAFAWGGCATASTSTCRAWT